MKIFVTGATGFVGAYFVRAALSAGHEVVALRRSEESALPISLPHDPMWLTKKLEDLEDSNLAGCDALVHFAATGVSPKPATWEECFRFNVLVSLSLAEKAKRAAVGRIIIAGSYAEYGKAGLRYDEIPPDAPLEPTDPYAASKAAGCIALTAYARNHQLRLFYGRIFSAFGEGQSSVNFWPQLRDAAWKGADFEMTQGEQIRDFIPIEKVADTFLHACTREDIVPGEPHIQNIASGIPISLRDFATEWWGRFHAKGQLKLGAVPYRPHEVMRYVPQI